MLLLGVVQGFGAECEWRWDSFGAGGIPGGSYGAVGDCCYWLRNVGLVLFGYCVNTRRGRDQCA